MHFIKLYSILLIHSRKKSIFKRCKNVTAVCVITWPLKQTQWLYVLTNAHWCESDYVARDIARNVGDTHEGIVRGSAIFLLVLQSAPAAGGPRWVWAGRRVKRSRWPEGREGHIGQPEWGGTSRNEGGWWSMRGAESIWHQNKTLSDWRDCVFSPFTQQVAARPAGGPFLRRRLTTNLTTVWPFVAGDAGCLWRI